MYQMTHLPLRNLLFILSMIGVLLHGSSVRAQTVTTVDALWAWDGQNVSVCQDPTLSPLTSNCFENLVNNPSLGSAPLATDGTYVYLATQSNGWAYKCPISDYGENCTQILVGPFNNNNAKLRSIAAYGGYLWIGQDDGSIYRCPSNIEWGGSIPSPNAEGCLLLDDAGNRDPLEMVIANGWLYVGLSAPIASNGLIWRCDLSTPNACTNFDNPGARDVSSLAVGAGYLWAGLSANLSGGILWRCDLNNANSCTVWDSSGGPVNAVSYDNQGGLAVGVGSAGGGVFWSCPTATQNSCSTIFSKEVDYTAAGILGTAKQYFAATSERAICYYSKQYPKSDQQNTKIPILYIPVGGVVTPGSVTLSFGFPMGSAASTASTLEKMVRDYKLAKLAKRCDHGGSVRAQVSLEGPYSTIRRNVDLCKLREDEDGVPKVNFGALDKVANYKYKATVRFEGFTGEAEFEIKNDEVEVVDFVLKGRGN